MSSNKLIIYITIISVLLIIACPTLYKIVKKNHERLYKVSEKYIIESAEKCYLDGKCKKLNVTLKDLYDNKYIKEELIDPVTKEVYKDTIFIEIKKDGSVINY